MNPRKLICSLVLLCWLSAAQGAEFLALGTAVEKALGTRKAFKKDVKFKGKKTTVFSAKGSGGTRYAVVQKGIYEPNCTHTWVVGLSPAAEVEQIQVVEMSCTHAFPTREESFLSQYTGKGPADVSKLKGSIHTVAKATGSSDLTTDAVIASISIVDKLKNK